MTLSKSSASSSGARIVGIAILLYFAEGLPFGLVTELFPLWLRSVGASLTAIGLLSTVSIAWTVKFLWAPLVDSTGTYLLWIRGALIVIASLLGGFAVFGAQPSYLWIAVALLVFASATQDIAIDAYTIVVTPREQLGRVNSVRVGAYRGAIILAGGALAAVGSWFGWSSAWIAAAMLVIVLIGATFFIPDPPARSGAALPTRSLRDWMARPDLVPLITLAFIYKLGDAALTPMVKPFWLDHGFSPAVIGTVTTAIAMTFTILGGLAGGAVVERIGIMNAMVALGVTQAASNIGYALLATTGAGHPWWYATAVIENFTGGLGTAAFLSFLMASSKREHAATDYAVLSGVFALTRTIAGSMSGVLSDRLGYAPWFWITVALGLPGIVAALAWRGRFTHFEAEAA